MDLPPQDQWGLGLLGFALVSAVGFLGPKAYDWIVYVDDQAAKVETNSVVIEGVAEDVKVIRDIVTEDHALNAAQSAELEIIKEITLENRALGTRFRESLDED